MQPVHLHLMLNHVPVVGAIFVTLFLAFATWRGRPELSRAALAAFALIALVAIVVFLTGEPAEERVESIAGISERAIHAHEEFAELALMACVAGGGISLGLLWLYRRRDIPRMASGAALLAAVVVSVAMGITANLGGKIRHTEISSTTADSMYGSEGR